MHAPRIPGIPTTQVSPGILTSKLKAFFVLASFLEIFLRGEHNYTGGKFLNVFFNLLVVAILLFFQAFIQTSGSMSNAKFSKPLWHLVDANGQVVGRLASQIVRILRGKHKPSYTPNYDCGDFVVVVNAGSIKFTGQKTNDKLYKWHTGYPGGLKQISVRDQLDRKPEEVILSQVMIFNFLKSIKSNIFFFDDNASRKYPGSEKGGGWHASEEQHETNAFQKTSHISWR